MVLPKSILQFLGKFALMYGLLIAPWPQLNSVYARVFRSAGNGVFARENDRCFLRFEKTPEALGHLLDTRILLADREAPAENGHIPAMYLELDTRAVGWISTAMVVALILSTPMVWSRKMRALLWGLLAIHVFILFSVAVYIWNHSSDVGLLTLNPFTKHLLEGLEETLITQLGTSFVAPVVIWILVVFRTPYAGVGHRLNEVFLNGGTLTKPSVK